MFSNLGTPSTQSQGFVNQNQTFNKSSPFSMGFQKTNTNTSIFQSPTQNSFIGQQTTPSIFQNTNTPRTTSIFGGGTTFNTSFTSPSAGIQNNQPQSSLFGSKPTQNFGSSFQQGFGQPTTTQTAIPLPAPNMFGSQTQGTTFGSNTFGSQPQTSQFMAPQSSSIFGSQPPASSAFGGSIFGSSNTTSSIFGQPKTTSSFPTFGGQAQSTASGTSSLFGAPQQSFNQTSSIFGSKQFGSTTTTAPSFTTSFGQPQSISQPSMFGQPTTSTNMFGQPSIFGQNQQTTGFGQTSTSLFPSSSTSNFPQMQSGFNAPQQPQSSLFGSGFGVTSSAPSTSQPFQPQFLSNSVPAIQFQTQSIFSQPSSFSSLSAQPLTTTAASIFGSGFNTQSSQPQSMIGGGFGVQFSQPRSNIFTSMPSAAPVSLAFTIPPVSQTVVFPGSASSASLLNNQGDKDVNLFGYKASGTRFGPPEYFNSTYNSLPDFNTVSDASLNFCSSVSAQNIESLSYSASEFDLKLGSTPNANNDYAIQEVPVDTISRLRFSRFQTDLLACSSWDGSISVWRLDGRLIKSGGCRVSFPGCAFDLDWMTSGTSLAFATSSGTICLLDVVTQITSEFARHSGPVKCLRCPGETNSNLIISGSYDGTVRLWDIRSKLCAATINAGSKVYDLAITKSNFGFINALREIQIFGYTDHSRPILRKKIESSPYPLRSLAMSSFNCRKDGGFVAAIGTCGGKVSIVANSNNAKDFTFKVNRINLQNRMNAQQAFAIHGCEFHPISNVFASAGGDGSISLWDIQKHQEVETLNRSTLPVTSLSFSSDGKLLAYAIGYDWSRGIAGYKYKQMRPFIYIRTCQKELTYRPPDSVYHYS